MPRTDAAVTDSDQTAQALAALQSLIVAGELFRLRAAQSTGQRLNDSYALTHLESGQGLSQSQLADLLGLTSGGATALLDRLEAAGMAQRRPDPLDRRRHVLELTPRARELMGATRAGLARVFDGFDEERLGRVASELTELAGRVGQEAAAMAALADAGEEAKARPGR